MPDLDTSVGDEDLLALYEWKERWEAMDPEERAEEQRMVLQYVMEEWV